LNGFSFALVMGIIFGTYSSVFIASPILIFWQNLIESRKHGAASTPVIKASGGPSAGAPAKLPGREKSKAPGVGVVNRRS